MKNPNEPVGNRTRHIPACSEVPQLSASQGAPPQVVWLKCMDWLYLSREKNKWLKTWNFVDEHSGSIKHRKCVDYLVEYKTLNNNASSQFSIYFKLEFSA